MLLARTLARTFLGLKRVRLPAVTLPRYCFQSQKPAGGSQQKEEAPHKASTTAEETPEETTQQQPKPGVDLSAKQKPQKATVSPQGDASTVRKIGDMMARAWRITFPNEEDEVKRKFEERKKKAQLKPKYTAEELEQIQMEIPEERRTALAETKLEVKEEKKPKGIIPQAVKSKIAETEFYKKASEVHKEYSGFKEDLKEYISSKDNIAIQATVAAYGKVSRGSEIARAIEYMREHDPEFEAEDIEAEATHIFVTSYQNFLQGKPQELQKTCNDQALDFFKSHINLYRTRKVKPKITKLWDHNICQLSTAKFDDKSPPTFVFRIEVQEIYCFEDLNGKIVDGDEERLMRSTFEYGVRASGDKLEEHGHNWEIIEIRKIDEVKLLV